MTVLCVLYDTLPLLGKAKRYFFFPVFPLWFLFGGAAAAVLRGGSVKQYAASCGPYRLTLAVRLLGRDVQLLLTGGAAHIGAVALAVPRAGLRHAESAGADASVLCVSGHREDLLARETALRVSRAWRTVVCATCGIHFDGLDEEGITTVLSLARRLTDRLLADPPPLPLLPHGCNAVRAANTPAKGDVS